METVNSFSACLVERLCFPPPINEHKTEVAPVPKHEDMKEYRGRGLTPPPGLDLGVRWVWEVSFRLVLAFPRGQRKRPRQRLHRQLGGSKTRSWCDQLEASLQRTELWFCNLWPVALLCCWLTDSTYKYCRVFINFVWLIARLTSHLLVRLPFSNKEFRYQLLGGHCDTCLFTVIQRHIYSSLPLSEDPLCLLSRRVHGLQNWSAHCGAKNRTPVVST
jgi:hypothetical protein